MSLRLDRTLGDAESAGIESGRRYGRSKELPDGEFGRYSDRSRFGALVLRRALLTGHVPLSFLQLLRPIAGSFDRLAAFDTFLRRYAYWRGVRRGLNNRDAWLRLQRGPLILMYHAIGRTRSEPASAYVVPRRRFESQMAWLRWRGYAVLQLRDLIDCLRSHRLPPRRSVVITFDDGYADNFDHAAPVLRRYGFPATVFVVSGAIGSRASWPTEPPLAGRPMASRGQLDAMARAGWEIGAHTRAHPSLASLSGQVQDEEIRGAREDLQQRLGRSIVTFSYPFGDYDRDVALRVERAGYHGACCSRSGINDPMTPVFELRRVEVRGTDSLAGFAMMLWRGHRAAPALPSCRLEHATT